MGVPETLPDPGVSESFIELESTLTGFFQTGQFRTKMGLVNGPEALLVHRFDPDFYLQRKRRSMPPESCCCCCCSCGGKSSKVPSDARRTVFDVCIHHMLRKKGRKELRL